MRARDGLYRQAEVRHAACRLLERRVVPGGHCQVGVERAGFAAADVLIASSDSGTGRLPPGGERTGAQETMVDCTQQVSPNPKQIQHDAVHRQEALRVSDGREPAHLAFALTGWLV